MEKKTHQIDIKALLLATFNKEKFFDVFFACKNDKDEWTKIGAHKLVLVAVSDVFETMFYGNVVKNGGVNNEDVVKIEDIKFNVFSKFISFIYGKKTVFDSGTNDALEFLYTANKYNCTEAKNLVGQFLLEDVDSHNAITYYETAAMFNVQALKDVCLKIFETDTLDVLCCPDFVNAKPETVEIIFTRNFKSKNNETKFVWALERYVNFNKRDDPDIFEKIRPVIKQIDFNALTAKEIARTSLLTENEKKTTNVRVNAPKLKQKLTTMEMIRALYSVYTEKDCVKCEKNNMYSSYKTKTTHPYWLCLHCSNSPPTIKAQVKQVYEKYHHTFLFDYDVAGVEIIYSAYKEAGLVK